MDVTTSLFSLVEEKIKAATSSRDAGLHMLERFEAHTKPALSIQRMCDLLAKVIDQLNAITPTTSHAATHSSLSTTDVLVGVMKQIELGIQEVDQPDLDEPTPA